MNRLAVTPYRGTFRGKKFLWKLTEPFKYKEIHVPAGFKTDFASVPRFFWRLIPPFGRYCEASVVHDYCYFKGLYTREQCDTLFLEVMKKYKVPGWKRWFMHRSVRWFGWIGWRKHHKGD